PEIVFEAGDLPRQRRLGNVEHFGRLGDGPVLGDRDRSEEHPSELQSHRDLHSFPTRRSSDLPKSCSRLAICRDNAGWVMWSTSAALETVPCSATATDRKSTRLNSSPTEISTLSLHDALPISRNRVRGWRSAATTQAG